MEFCSFALGVDDHSYEISLRKVGTEEFAFAVLPPALGFAIAICMVSVIAAV